MLKRGHKTLKKNTEKDEATKICREIRSRKRGEKVEKKKEQRELREKMCKKEKPEILKKNQQDQHFFSRLHVFSIYFFQANVSTNEVPSIRFGFKSEIHSAVGYSGS